MTQGNTPWFIAAGGVIALLCLLGSLRLRRRHRLLRDTPTSKAQGVFIGLVELEGTAECTRPLTGYLSAHPCVHFAYEVQEHWSRTVTETYTDKDGRNRTRTRHESGWTTVADGGDTLNFFVRDDTGVVLVRPAGAKIEPRVLFDETVSRGEPLYFGKGPASAVANSDHRRRFIERGIPWHAPLFVVGQARERDDVVAPEIASDREAPLFLISTRTEETVQSGSALGSWFLWVFGLLAALGAAWLASNTANSQVAPAAWAPFMTTAAALYLAVWGIGWVWMVFNSLVSLRQRVRQGWSLIEVQLKRRHDLIPNLVAAVAGLQTHERESQTALAAMRAQLAATPPGVSGPDFDGVAADLRAVIEKFPALTAQEGFSRLHAELVETEQRIALARTYYNDIATHFATRLEQVPDCFVARLARMRREPLLAAAGFERARIDVVLAS